MAGFSCEWAKCAPVKFIQVEEDTAVGNPSTRKRRSKGCIGIFLLLSQLQPVDEDSQWFLDSPHHATTVHPLETKGKSKQSS